MVRTVQKVFPEDSALILMLFNFRSAMNWTEKKDILLLKEMGGQGIFHYKAGSRERGAVWQVIASNLNCHKDLFEVTARGVRDRFTLPSRRHKSKTSREIKGSGTGGEELTEYEILIEDMIALSEESDKKAESEAENAKANANADRQKALEIRKKAMETMGESKKRLAVDEEVKEKKKRRSGVDTMSWLKEKTEIDAKLKEKELEDQKQEKEIERRERNEQMALLRHQLQMQVESQQQQQQQQNMIQQQLMALMQQQQQQMQLMFSNISKGDKK